MEVKLSDEAEDKLAERIAEKIISKSNEKNSAKKSKEEKLYKVSDIAKNTGQSPSTITRHINNGLLKANKIGLFWMVNEENYKNYINNQSSDHE